MKFTHGSRRTPLEYEKELVKLWKLHKTFEQSVANRPASKTYVFYDGPPFITGVPHHGTLLSSIVKDAVPRYWTMKGKRVERVWGWDCHGLPAEVFTEKKLGITDKRDIGTKISLEDYIKACRENMVMTGKLWEDTIDRIGRWVDFRGAYKTMGKEYMESVWWAFKELYNKGKIYEGEKVLLYCIRDATPLSKAEVAMDNSYQNDTDPSVYVKFKLAGSDSYLLAWTTTPWTLPSNTALAVSKDITYAEVELAGEKLILAKDLLDNTLTDETHEVLPYKILKTFKGSELVGKSYEPLFTDRGENAHKIWDAWFIHTDEGTGIAHESPAYGEEDYQLSKEMHFPMVMDTDEEGFYTEGEWKGKQNWEVNKEIAKTLQERGVVWKIQYVTHPYPHCHRCGTKLMYRAHPSWFMNIDGQRQVMLDHNESINWFPEHIKRGRFEKTVESAPDWNISRDRFWATAMPVWKGTDTDGNELVRVVGSYAELKELSGRELDDYHRPWIDDVTFKIDGVEYKRVDKVMDSWFEAGSMPFAQFHYPFENTQKFEANFPGDFIVEYIGQVRAWFYYLHAMSNGLFEKNSFKNVIVTGTLLGSDGRKLSKSLGNYTDPNILMDQYSADALRFLLLSSPALAGEDFEVHDKDVSDVRRKLAMIWNMFDFFTMYAEVDGWEWNGDLYDPTPELQHQLDLWIVSRVHQVTQEVDEQMQRYDLPNALKPLLELIDDASNWYVRRSRKRFWKSDNDHDKQQAYKTLHYALVQLAVILAPFTPFLSDELYQKLTGNGSVHLLDWPKKGHINKQLLANMTDVRFVISTGLALRAAAGIKVRQPLARVTLPSSVSFSEVFDEIIKEELNVKSVVRAMTDSATRTNGVVLDTQLTPALEQEGLAREIIRHVQSARKQAGLQVDDHIALELTSDAQDIQDAISHFAHIISTETLTDELRTGFVAGFETRVNVDGKSLTIRLEKVR